MNHDQHVKRKEYEKLFEEKPLTDEQMYQIECQIKRHKENPPMPRIDPETGRDRL